MKDWIMYHNIQTLKSKHYKKTAVCRLLDINFRTVDKYWDMSPGEYAATASNAKSREKKADAYRSEIISWLKEHPDMTAAQVYDWLVEKYGSAFEAKERTMRRYIAEIRATEDLPKPTNKRQYEAVDDPPMGFQAQVDMGEIWINNTDHKRIKIYCFAMSLSHSRYKFVRWQLMPFTTITFIEMHEAAFAFFGGRPKEIVYDQDKVLAVSENSGDIIYTEGFQNYLSVMKFGVRLCRGYDPESKGRIEAVIKYVKYNFAIHRTMSDIDSFNDDCLQWLKRRGNGKRHQITQKVPAEVFKAEQDFLTPALAFEAIASTYSVTYQVRKDNTVLYKSNRYRVPKNTYRPGITVRLEINGSSMVITDAVTNVIYARHTIPQDKGRLIPISHTDRDPDKKLCELQEMVQKLLGESENLCTFLDRIHTEKVRYYTDQLNGIRKVCENSELKGYRYKALNYCMKYNLFSASSFKEAAEYYNELSKAPERASPSSVSYTNVPSVNPKIRDINDYKKLMR